MSDVFTDMLHGQLADVGEFQRDIIGIRVPDAPTMLPEFRQEARADHLAEELAEFREARSVAAAADACIDLIYLAHGALVEMGVASRAAFDEVHAANMRKRRGSLSRRPKAVGYDAVKPKDWRGPDWESITAITAGQVRKLEARAAHLEAENARLQRALCAPAEGPPFLGGPARGGSAPELLVQLSTGEFVRPFPAGAARPSGGGADTGFMKHDDGKASRPELIPAFVLDALSRLYAYGARKYAAENWRKGSSYQRYVGAAERHLLRWRVGEDFDVGEKTEAGWSPGSGSHHLVCAAWNLLTLYAQQTLGVGEDDCPERQAPCGAGIELGVRGAPQ